MTYEKKIPMRSEQNHSTSHIGMLNEKPLHAAIKSWYAKPNDEVEVDLYGYVVDILRDDLIIEIQTKSFSKIRTKLSVLSNRHPIRLVHPIPMEKWIIKVDQTGENQLSRRKSPKRGSYVDLFHELVSIPALLKKPKFALEVLLIQEEEIRIHDPHRAWRRKGWITQERRLLDVVEKRRFSHPKEFKNFIPSSIHGAFTTPDLAAELHISSRLAGKMTYCLREMEAIVPVGKRGRAILYTRS
jgi:hypothetical protein